MKTKTIQIEESVYNIIQEYCNENNLKIGQFCSDLLKKNIMIEKYGDMPFGVIQKIEPIIKIKEKIDEQKYLIGVDSAIEEDDNTAIEIFDNNGKKIDEKLLDKKEQKHEEIFPRYDTEETPTFENPTVKRNRKRRL